MSVHDVPPELGEALSWRKLWRSRGFALRELVPDSVFSSRAADRGLRLGIGQAPLEELDVQDVLQPVAFAAGGNPHDFKDVAPFEPRMTFREEEPAREWRAYAWDHHGRPHTFWLRYFSPCYTTPFNVSDTSANDECSSIWDINSSSPTLSPITVPTQSQLAGSTAEGQADAQAFVSALTTVYDEVHPLLIPTNNQLYVWLDQEEAYGLSLDYWNGWATYVGLNAFGGDTAEPLYPCLYCTPDAAAANCSTIQNSGAFPTVGVWSSEWQECGTSLAHPPSWNAQSCSATLTVLWQFCDGTGICNGSDVDQDLNYPGFSLADFSFYLSSHP